MTNIGEREPIVRAHLRQVVATWLSTATGGAERSVAELATGLARVVGLVVSLIWWDYDGHGPAPDSLDGVEVLRVAGAKAYARALRGQLAIDPAGTALISTHRTALMDVAVAREHRVVVIPVLRALLLTGQRLRTLDPASGRLDGRAPAELDWSLLSTADCWVGVSRAASASLAEHASTRLRVQTIYNGVPINGRAASARSGRVRRFAVVARAERWKRIDRVVSAFGQLPPDLLERLHLDVYGHGPALTALRQLAASTPANRSITFHGYVPDRWVQASDVLVSGCDTEAFGRAVVEAAASGMPAIVPDRGGSAELLVPGVTGMTYDPDQPDAFAEAMARAAAWTAHEVETVGRQAHAHARRFFSTHRCVIAYARLAATLYA